MNVLVLGGAGMLGPYVVPVLAQHYRLRVTDVKPMSIDFDGEFQLVDIADREQVMRAAEGMDAIVNLSVLRHDRKVAFDVNTMGCYNMMEAAVEHGIRRIINTGPHFTFAGKSYELFDYDISPEIPPQPGTNLYALTKSLGHEITATYAAEHDLYVQMYLFYNFRSPDALPRERAVPLASSPRAEAPPEGRGPEGPRAEAGTNKEVRPFAVYWQNAAEVFPLGLEIDLKTLPSRCEVFYVFTDMPHGKFQNEKVKRILGWKPRNDIDRVWHAVPLASSGANKKDGQ